MKNNLDLSKIVPLIATFFQRFHTTIFIVIIVFGLSYAVLALNGLIAEASNTTTQQPSDIPGATSNDQATIDRIKELRSSSDAPDSIPLPGGRINPFVE